MISQKKQKIVVAAILLVLAVFLPELVSAGWHLIYGDSVTFRTWKVEVPFEWYAVRRGEGISVERMIRIPWLRGPVAIFLPVHFTKQFNFQYDLYAEEQQKTLSGRGYQLEGQRDLKIAGEDARCWTFGLRSHEKEVWIACIAPKDLTSVDFIGSRTYSPGFFSLLQKIQPAKTAP
jgi:hypothetical protein